MPTASKTHIRFFALTMEVVTKGDGRATFFSEIVGTIRDGDQNV
jgi:hypothetical protein